MPNSGNTAPYGVFSNFVEDKNPFGRPLLGGSVAVMYGTVSYTTTTDTTLFTLPARAVIVQWLVDVKTAFNDSGTDLLNIGGAASNTYAASLDVSATGQIPNGYVASQMFATPLATDTAVTAKYTGQNGNANAGSAVVCCFYVLM